MNRNAQLSGAGRVVIEPFRREDQEPARELILQGLGEHWGFIDRSLNPDLVDIAQSYEMGHFVVAWIDGVLVGTGGYMLVTSEQIDIRRMSVEREDRRRGIASLILGALLSHARAAGRVLVTLETNATWTDAISFYRRSGFQQTAVRDGEAYFEMHI